MQFLKQWASYNAPEAKEAIEKKEKPKLPTTSEADKESELTLEETNPELLLQILDFFSSKLENLESHFQSSGQPTNVFKQRLHIPRYFVKFTKNLVL